MPDSIRERRLIHDSFAVFLREGIFVPSMNICVRRPAALDAASSQKFLPSANDLDLMLGIAAHGDYVFEPRALIDCERLLDGISAKFERSQMCYSLLAAKHRLGQVSERQVEYRQAFRDRAIERWPVCFSRSVFANDVAMAFKVLLLGLQFGCSFRTPKLLYWALDDQFRRRESAGRLEDSLGK